MRSTMRNTARKYLSFFLSLCLLLGAFPALPAAAADGDMYLMTFDAPINVERADGTFYVPVHLVNGSSAAGYRITIQYDPVKVKSVSVAADTALHPAINFQDKANGRVVVTLADAVSVTAGKDDKTYLFELAFVPADNAEGSLGLALTGEFWGVDGNKLTTVSASQVPEINIHVGATGVSLYKEDGTSISSLSLFKYQQMKIVAKIAPADATNQAIVYASSNSGVATVDAGGNITAIAAGTADITATAEGGLSAVLPVSVTVPALKVSGISNQAVVSSDVTVVAQSAYQPITIKNRATGVVLASGTDKATWTAGSEGQYQLEMTNGTETANLNFEIRKTAPAIDVTGVSDGQINRNQLQGVAPRVVFGASATTKTVLLNGSSYVLDANGYGAPIAAPGIWKLDVTARDVAGNTANKSVVFENRYDLMPPVIQVTGVAQNGIYASATPVVSLLRNTSVAEADSNASNYTAAITLTRPDGSQTTYSRTSVMPSLTMAGEYRLDVQATNPSWASMVATATVTFRIDATAPTAAITGVDDNALYNQPVSPFISWTDDQASQSRLWQNATVTLTRNGTESLGATWTNGDSLTADGRYVLTAKTSDAVGRQSNLVTRTFTIDRTSPAISVVGVLDGATYKDTNVTVSVKSSEPGAVIATPATGTTLPAKVVSEGFDTYTFTGMNGEVVHHALTFTATDAAGNKATRTVSFTIDRQPVNLLISGVTEGLVTKNKPVITAVAYNGSTLLTEGLSMTMDGAPFTGGAYAGTEGAHTLVARLVYNGQTYTKTVKFMIDKTAPGISGMAVQKNSQSVTGALFVVKSGDVVTVSAKVADASTLSDVFLRVGARSEKIPMALAAGIWSGTFTADNANDANLPLSVSATDKAGNIATGTAAARMDMDNLAPVVTMQLSPETPAGRNGIYNDATLMVALSAGTGETVYWTLQNGSSAAVAGTPAQTVQVRNFADGLNQLAWYAVDAAGNRSQTQTLSFRQDTTAPANVTVNPFSAVTNSSSLTLEGAVAGETDIGTRVVVQKQISIAGVLTYETVGQVNITTNGTNGTFSVGGLRLSEGMNRFRLRAEDVAGNTSPIWYDAVSVTLDTSAPVLSLAKETETTYALTANEPIDNISASFNGIAASVGTLSAGKRIITTAEPQEGGNVLLVNATDNAGNRGSGSLTISWIPPNTAQNNLPVSENTTLDIPAGAFDEETNMTVRTVEMDGALQYKPVTAPLEFDFGGVIPSEPLLIRMFVGYGLTGLTLIHDDDGILEEKVATAITESELDTMLGEGTFPTDGTPYYVTDTGEIVFKTSDFSSYQVAQDSTAPVIRFSSVPSEINKSMWDAGIVWSLAIDDQDPAVSVTSVQRNLVSIGTGAVTMGSAALNGSLSTRTATINLRDVLVDGQQDVRIVVQDAAGNETVLTRTMMVDKTSVLLTAVPQRVLTRDASVLLQLSTSEDAAIEYSRDGATWLQGGRLNGDGTMAVSLQEGVNAYQVRATDVAGNVTTVQVATVTRDATPPEITVNGIGDGDVRGEAVTISATATEATVPILTLDGVPFESGNTVSAVGMHTLVVVAVDAAGNESTLEIDFTIDTSVPVITYTGVVDGAVGNEAVTFEVATENADVFTVTKSANGGAVESIVVPDGASSITETIAGQLGEHQNWTITVYATRIVGGQLRAATSTFHFTIDRKGPGLVVNPVAATTAEKVTLQGTVDEVSDVYLNNVLKLVDQPAGAFSIPDTALAVGSNAFTLKAVDALGNETIVTMSITRNQDSGETGEPGGTGGTGGTGGGIPAAPGSVAPPPASPSGNTSYSPLPRQATDELPAALEPYFGAVVDGAELADVGQEGGLLVVGNNTLRLRIPAGAVNNESLFRVVQFVLDATSLPGQADDVITGRLVPVSPVFDIGTTAAKLEKPVPATFSYDKSRVQLPSRLRLFYWHVRLNAWMPVADANPVLDASSGMVTVNLDHFSRYCVMEVTDNLSFADVSTEWFAPYVKRLALAGATVGTLDNGTRRFLPNQTITRNEFAVLLCRALKIEPVSGVLTFKDAEAIPFYAKGYVKAAVQKGIIKGFADGTFGGGKTLTRAEMVTMLMRASSLKAGTEPMTFKDASLIPAYATGAVAKAVELGVILGKTGNQFAPHATATRAEVAKVLVEMVEVLAGL